MQLWAVASALVKHPLSVLQQQPPPQVPYAKFCENYYISSSPPSSYGPSHIIIVFELRTSTEPSTARNSETARSRSLARTEMFRWKPIDWRPTDTKTEMSSLHAMPADNRDNIRNYEIDRCKYYLVYYKSE